MAPKSIYEKLLQAEKNSTIDEIEEQERSRKIRVHMPCKVKSVHGSTVDVEIQGSEDTGLGFYSPFPVLLDLPIIYNNYTTKAYIITPIQVGDTGLVEFLDFNATNFQNEGNNSLTTDEYYHSLNNGTFINGFIPTSNHMEIPTGKPIIMGLHNKTFTFEVSDDGNLVISTPTLTVNGNLNVNGTITGSSTITASGEITGNGVALSTHTHTGCQGSTPA